MKSNVLFDPDPGTGGGAATTGITQEQFHAGIEKARLEERTKLHAEIEKSAAATKAAEDKIVALQQTVTKLTDSITAIEKAKTTSGEVDVKALITEITAAAEKRITEATAQERQELSQRVQSLQQNLSSVQLEKLRTQLVQEAGGPDKLVMALVRGDDEASLRANIKIAQESYAAIEQRIKPGSAGSSQNPNANNTRTTAPPPINPGGDGGAGAGTEGSILDAGSVKQLSPSEYKANRAKVLADLNRRYPARAY